MGTTFDEQVFTAVNERLSTALDRLVEECKAKQEKITFAESCTGGGLAHYLTDYPGVSSIFDMSFVTYSNESKQQLLRVKADTLACHGAVSEPVVQEMVLGAVKLAKADAGIAVSGIAGPSGGTTEKPVGTICFGLYRRGEIKSFTHHFKGVRRTIREQVIIFALEALLKMR